MISKSAIMGPIAIYNCMLDPWLLIKDIFYQVCMYVAITQIMCQYHIHTYVCLLEYMHMCTCVTQNNGHICHKLFFNPL